MAKLELKIAPSDDGRDAIYNAVVGYAKFGFSKSLFAGALDERRKKALFKQFVTRVLFEISAYCNRRCVFCPNKTGLRLTKDQQENTFPLAKMETILDALADIEYDKDIVLHLFNEPMADPELVDKVALITEKLPKASVWFNTNGDYLSRKKLEALTDAKLTRMNISLYGPNHGEFDVGYLKNSFRRVFEHIGKEVEITEVNAHTFRSVLSFHHNGRELPIVVMASNFNEIGYDRGKSVGDGDAPARSSPCSSVFSEVNIAWDGTVVPCCNIHPHEPQHQQYVIGKVETGEDLFDIYHAEAIRGWRRQLVRFGSYDAPCDTCTRFNYPNLETTPKARDYNKSVDALLNDIMAG